MELAYAVRAEKCEAGGGGPVGPRLLELLAMQDLAQVPENENGNSLSRDATVDAGAVKR